MAGSTMEKLTELGLDTGDNWAFILKIMCTKLHNKT